MQTILTNARLVTEQGVIDGTIVFDRERILAIDPGASHAPGAIDVEQDLLAPGLIECHTDNLEKHFVPRPKVMWPNALAATLAHDAQMAAAGVTTVYDAICVGGYDGRKDYRTHIMAGMIDAVQEGVRHDMFRIDHKVHLRCELSDHEMTDKLAPYEDGPLVALVSLMDHTPGQRQWRDVEHYRTFVQGEGRSAAEVDDIIAYRQGTGSAAAPVNWRHVVDLFRGRGIPIASHDDTDEAHVAEAVASGCTISEFPTTVDAARAAKQQGMWTVGGAPNVVRGGSHSGGVAIEQLARQGLLDALSSDYVPASLLQAVKRISDDKVMPLHEAFGLVTWRPADMLGLADRGRLEPGLRPDMVRLRFVGDTPVVREVIRGGQRVL